MWRKYVLWYSVQARRLCSRGHCCLHFGTKHRYFYCTNFINFSCLHFLPGFMGRIRLTVFLLFPPFPDRSWRLHATTSNRFSHGEEVALILRCRLTSVPFGGFKVLVFMGDRSHPSPRSAREYFSSPRTTSAGVRIYASPINSFYELTFSFILFVFIFLHFVATYFFASVFFH